MLLAKDGFDVNTAANASLKWNSVGAAGTLITGVYGKGLAIQNADRTKTLLANVVTGFQGFHFYFAAGSAVAICGFLDGSTTQVDLRADATGALFFTRNGTTIGAVSSFRMTAPGWYWIVPKVTIDPSAGVASVEVNSVSVLAQTGLNTRATGNSFYNQLNIKASGGGHAIDNWHAWDTVGGDSYNAFLAETLIGTSLGTGAGSNAAWTPNAGTNFSRVNEQNEDGDTTYNLSATPGQIDSFVFANLLESSGVILDVAVNTVDRIDDATPRVINHYVKSAAATALGAAISPGASYVNHQSSFAVDPNTGVAWTVAGRNAAEFGYKLIS